MHELPDDLFASEVANVAKTHLRRFNNGETTRDEVLETAVAEIKSRLVLAMNTIAATKGKGPDDQRL